MEDNNSSPFPFKQKPASRWMWYVFVLIVITALALVFIFPDKIFTPSQEWPPKENNQIAPLPPMIFGVVTAIDIGEKKITFDVREVKVVGRVNQETKFFGTARAPERPGSYIHWLSSFQKLEVGDRVDFRPIYPDRQINEEFDLLSVTIHPK